MARRKSKSVPVKLTGQEVTDIMRGLRNAIGRLQERRRRTTDPERIKEFTVVEDRLGALYNKFGQVAWENDIRDAFGLDDPV